MQDDVNEINAAHVALKIKKKKLKGSVMKQFFFFEQRLKKELKQLHLLLTDFETLLMKIGRKFVLRHIFLSIEERY